MKFLLLAAGLSAVCPALASEPSVKISSRNVYDADLFHRSLSEITTFTSRSDWENEVGGVGYWCEDFSTYNDTNPQSFQSQSVDLSEFTLSVVNPAWPNTNRPYTNRLKDEKMWASSYNNDYTGGLGAAHPLMHFYSPITAWGGDFEEANTGATFDFELELHCAGGTIVIQMHESDGFFGWTLAYGAALEIEFVANNPGTVVEGIIRDVETFYLDNVCAKPCPGGCSKGDPHFQTWTDQWFDFHGICDLVLVSAPDFANGLGLDIHIRTKPRYEYSYIEAAAIKIGDDILEVGSWNQYWVNDVQDADLPFTMGGKFTVALEVINKKRHVFRIQAPDSYETIIINIHKDLVNIDVANATNSFLTSTGMMGNFKDGTLLARDGVTVMDNHDLFGQEWQVTESDPQIFLSPSPYMGHHCVPPHTIDQGRRLEGSTISEDAAAMACSQYDDQTIKDMCVFDVIAMGDLSMAEIHGAY